MTRSSRTAMGAWPSTQECRLDDLRAAVEVVTQASDYPYADEVRDGVLVYGPGLHEAVRDPGERREVQAELARALSSGPGIVVFSGAFAQPSVVDRASTVFRSLIDDQRAAGTAGGDHFAAPGANDRVWGALDKFALRDPGAFADYYSNDALALVAQAWLGPGYQVTSQINVVNPGGVAQVAHRDYHLGFMSATQSLAFPAHVHRLSPALTLQGAVAHCDMPVVTGPTMYLPHSQKYPLGFLAWRRPEFVEYFHAHHTQLPLRKGDAVFFSPALFHAAGSNHTTDVKRMANLLQISSAMARAMETMDRIRMSKAVYPALLAARAAGRYDVPLHYAAVAAADGYAFPTNLDNDPPLGGLTPPSHLDILLAALADGVPPAEFDARVDALATRRRSA